MAKSAWHAAREHYKRVEAKMDSFIKNQVQLGQQKNFVMLIDELILTRDRLLKTNPEKNENLHTKTPTPDQ